MKRMMRQILCLLAGVMLLASAAHAATLKFEYTFDDSAARGLNAANPDDPVTDLSLFGAEGTYAYTAGVMGSAGDSALGLDGLHGSPHMRYWLDSGVEYVMPQQFTATMWIKPHQKTSYQFLFSNTYAGDLQNGFHLVLNSTGGGPGSLGFNTNNEKGVDHHILVESAGGVVAMDQWQLITILVDRTANTVKGYVNTTKVLDGATANGFNVDTRVNGSDNAVVFVGGYGDSNNFMGSIDDVRVYDGLLTTAEIQGIVDAVGPISSNTPTPTPTVAPITDATLKFEYKFNDSTARGLNTANPDDPMTYLSLFGAEGTYDYPLGLSGELGDAALGVDGTKGNPHMRYWLDSGVEYVMPQQFSVAMWLKPQQKAEYQFLYSNTYAGDLQNGFHLVLNSAAGEGSLGFNTNNEKGVDHHILVESAPGVVKTGQWQMVTILVDRTANTVKGYVNSTKVLDGVTVNGFNVDTRVNGSENAVVFLGGVGDTMNYFGSIDDFRFYEGLLSQSDIDGLVSAVIHGTPVNSTRSWVAYE